MEILLTLVGIWIVWIMFKGKYQRDQIREALDDIRIHASRAPFKYMMSSDQDEFIGLWPHFSESKKNEFVGKMIMLGLAEKGLAIDHIPVNIRLSRHFMRTMEEVKDSLDQMSVMNR